MKMDRELCEEIKYRVKRYLAPRSKEPGVVELSYIWGLWRDEATEEEIENCLKETGAVLRSRGDEKYFIYPSIAREAYRRMRDEHQKRKKDLSEKKREKEALEKEMRTMKELRAVWLESWEDIHLGDLQGMHACKVTPGLISTFVSRNFQLEEGRIKSSIDKKESLIKQEENEIRAIESKIENLKEKLDYV